MSEHIETKRCIKTLYKYFSFHFLYFYSQPQSITILWLVLIYRLAERRGLSWADMVIASGLLDYKSTARSTTTTTTTTTSTTTTTTMGANSGGSGRVRIPYFLRRFSINSVIM